MSDATEFSVRVLLAVAFIVLGGGFLAVSLPVVARFERRIVAAVLGVYIVRTLVTVTLFAASASHMPALAPYAGPAGTWLALPDAAGYHAWGIDFAAAASRGIDMTGLGAYPSLVGALYSVIGYNALVPTLLNPAFDVVTLVALLILGRHFSGSAPPASLVWVVGLWPSWVIWSSQLLRDSLMLTLGVAGLTIAASVLARGPNRGGLPRYRPVVWPVLAALAGLIGWFRPAVADILTAALLAVVGCTLYYVARRRTTWKEFAIAIVLAVVVLQSQMLLRALVGVDDVTMGAAYAELGSAYEREGTPPAAVRAYRSALSIHVGQRFAYERLLVLDPASLVNIPPPPPLLAGGPDTPVVAESILRRVRRVLLRFVNNFGTYMARLRPSAFANLRDANLLGDAAFGSHVDASATSGLLHALLLGVAHTLFGPFPWAVWSSGGTSGMLRSFSLVDLPWVYGVVVFGVIGALAARPRIPAVTVLVVTFAALGVVALALAVPNDGLLFRYRLPFLAPLVAFAPAGLAVLGRLLARRQQTAPLLSNPR